jgi:Peptidase family M48
VPIGAAWLRRWSGSERGYGFVNETTPELFDAVCLSVSESNQARQLSRMLRRAGTSEQLPRMTREAAATMGLARNVEVSVVDGRVCRLLWVGRRGRVIVLPAQLVDELDEEQLLDILRHELAHYVRRDHWSNQPVPEHQTTWQRLEPDGDWGFES